MKLPEDPESTRADIEMKWRGVSSYTVSSGRVEIAGSNFGGYSPLGMGDERGTLEWSAPELRSRGTAPWRDVEHAQCVRGDCYPLA